MVFLTRNPLGPGASGAGARAAIGRQLGASTPTVLAWRHRYDAGGIEALADLPRSGRPSVIDDRRSSRLR